SAELDVRTQGLALGLPVLDHLLGSSPHLVGRFSQVYDGYTFDDARLDGSKVVASLAGQTTTRLADLGLKIELKDLSALDPKLSGRATLDGHLAGSLERPDLVATLNVADAAALSRPVREFRVEAMLRDLAGALDGTI